MKVSAIALALFFALGSTLAVAQGAGEPGVRAAQARGAARARVPVRAAQIAEAPVPAAQVAEPPVPAVQVPPVEGAQPEQLEQPAQPVALPT